MNDLQCFPRNGEKFGEFRNRCQGEFAQTLRLDALGVDGLAASRWAAAKAHKDEVYQNQDFDEPSLAVFVENNALYLYGEVGPWYDEVNIFAVRKAIKRIEGETLAVHISSPGGSVGEGYAIANYLLNLNRRVDTYVDGFSLSMGAIIALVGERRYINQLAAVMFHRVETVVMGNASDLRQDLAIVERLDEGLIAFVAERTGRELSVVQEAMQGEWWLTPDEALEANVAHEVIAEARAQSALNGSAQQSNANRVRMNAHKARTLAALSRTLG